MACQLFGAKPLHEAMLTYCQLNPEEQASVKLESFHENSFENVCEMAAILSRRGEELNKTLSSASLAFCFISSFTTQKACDLEKVYHHIWLYFR